MKKMISLRSAIYDADGLSSSMQSVAHALEWHCDESLHCWPSLETIAKRSRLTSRSVVTQLNLLVDAGILRRIHGLHASTTYAFVVPDRVVKTPWREVTPTVRIARSKRALMDDESASRTWGVRVADHEAASHADREPDSGCENNTESMKSLQDDREAGSHEGFKNIPKNDSDSFVHANRESDLFGEPVAKPMSKADRLKADLSRFDEFWQAYPRRAGKREALLKWEAVLKRGHTADAIIAAARRYAEQTRGKEEHFIKHASGWLNGERFADFTEPKRPDPVIEKIVGVRATAPDPVKVDAQIDMDALDPGEVPHVQQFGRRATPDEIKSLQLRATADTAQTFQSVIASYHRMTWAIEHDDDLAKAADDIAKAKAQFEKSLQDMLRDWPTLGRDYVARCRVRFAEEVATWDQRVKAEREKQARKRAQEREEDRRAMSLSSASSL